MKNKITSIVAHIDHGKTTLMDSLVAFQGYISKSLAGDARILDNREDEQQREITLKISLVKLKNGHFFLDTPGHVDFEALIHCSSIMASNFLIIVDVNEGIMPRTYSLVKSINKKRTILVLNKIDICKDFNEIEFIVKQMNGLVGSEVFKWENNNIILASAFLCSGICYSSFKFNIKNTLKNAFKTFRLLDEKYEKDDIGDILKKYDIKYKSKKSVFSNVMPLYKAIFETIDCLYTENVCNSIPIKATENLCIKKENVCNSIPIKATENLCIKKENVCNNIPIKATENLCIKKENVCNNIPINKEATMITREYSLQKNPAITEKISKENTVIDNILYKNEADQLKYSLVNKNYEIRGNKKPDLLGITVYGIFETRGIYEINNVLFVFKILKGRVRKGERVFNINEENVQEVTIEKIYSIDLCKYIEKEFAEESEIVLIKGNFMKNSIISRNQLEFKIRKIINPFYCSVLCLENINDLTKIKNTIKAISYTEQCLTVKKNKYNELEFWCGGKVQFEKIINDLEYAGFRFKLKKKKIDVNEYPTVYRIKHYLSDEIEFIIEIDKIAQNEDIQSIINQSNESNKIKSSNINSDKINSDKINFDKINSDKINFDKINSDKINFDNINFDKINFDNINSDNINSDKINSDKINSSNINSDNISSNINSGNISSDKINSDNISSNINSDNISSNINSDNISGNINSGNINSDEIKLDQKYNIHIEPVNKIKLKEINENVIEDDRINHFNKITKSNYIVKEKNGNIFRIKCSEDLYIIESVLETFITQGPLVRENISRAKISIELIKSSKKIYNVLKNELNELYLTSAPQVAPRLYRLTILLNKNHIGMIYTILNKYNTTIEYEDFENETGFFKLVGKIPQFLMENIIDEIYLKTKGMAYVQLENSGYSYENDFSDLIEIIRESKGININKKIVENPEKQRTLRK